MGTSKDVTNSGIACSEISEFLLPLIRNAYLSSPQ